MGHAEGAVATDPLLAYVPQLTVDWLADEPDRLHLPVEGTCVFADISGFTALTERLAGRGRIGAEEMGELLNSVFDRLLHSAYEYGANLLKWGGDAVLLLFRGPAHARRAARASWAMQETMAGCGRLRTSVGAVRLGMSIGVHSGTFDFVLAGHLHRELVVTGPAASTTARMEKQAGRGQIVVSAETAVAIGGHLVSGPSGTPGVLVRPPDAEKAPNVDRSARSVALGAAFCEPLRWHLESGQVEHEHRFVAVGFIEFSGADELREQQGPGAMADAVAEVIDSAMRAAAETEVTLLATDISEDGGKIILVSGAPRSAGDDESRVLSALKRVVHPGGRLRLRGGVTSGKVFSGDYGPPYRRTYSITGDVVNLAARLMGAAGPGQVLATPEAVASSRTVFATSSVPPLVLKGKKEPVAAMVIGDPVRASAPLVTGRLPFVGRRREIEVLSRALAEAQSGRGRVVDICGEPGMGKSRLIEELAGSAPARRLWADGDIYARNVPYHPFRRLFRWTLGLAADASDPAVLATMRDLVEGTAPDLAPWMPLIGIVLGVDSGPTAEVESLDPSVRRERLEAVTSDLLGRLLREPVLFVFNDVHFMDEATLSLIRRLAADATNRPWLVVLTRRPDFASPLTTRPADHEIDLEPISDEETGRFLAAATRDRPVPSHRLRQVAARAGGNPLFLLELVAGGAAATAGDDLPESIEAVVAGRIDRLEVSHRRWLRVAAVLGDSIEDDTLSAVLDRAGVAALPVEDLAAFVTLSVDGLIRFRHSLIRSVAYEGLSYRRRSELHSIAVEAMQSGPHRPDPAVLSLHCLGGGLYERAWEYARRAADEARRQYALTEAAECYRRAVAAAAHLADPGPGEPAGVYEALADALADMGEMTEAERALRLARRHSDEPVDLARRRMKTAVLRQRVGRYADAERWLRRARDGLAGRRDAESRTLRAETATAFAVVRYVRGEHGASARWARKALAEAGTAGTDRIRARALETLAMASAADGRQWTADGFDAALDLYRHLGDRAAEAACYCAYGCAEYYAGRWERAAELFGLAESTYRIVGRERDAAVNAANRAEILVEQGRVDEAVPVLEDTITVCASVGAVGEEAFCHRVLAQALLVGGRETEAGHHLSLARTIFDDIGATDELAVLDQLECELRARAGAAAAPGT